MSTNKPEEKEAMNDKDANLPGEKPGAGMGTLSDDQLNDVSGGILRGGVMPNGFGGLSENLNKVGKDTIHRVFLEQHRN